MQDGECFVGASVVAHYNLIHFHRLIQDGLQLFANVMLAIVCAKSYREHGYFVLCARRMPFRK